MNMDEAALCGLDLQANSQSQQRVSCQFSFVLLFLWLSLVAHCELDNQSAAAYFNCFL